MPAREVSNVGMKRIRAALLLLTLAVAQPSPVAAGCFEGIAAFNGGDYATALRELRPLAEQGDASAQFLLGAMHDYRRGVLQDYSKAAKWLRRCPVQPRHHVQQRRGRTPERCGGIEVVSQVC